MSIDLRGVFLLPYAVSPWLCALIAFLISKRAPSLIAYELVDRNLTTDLVCCDRPRRWIDLTVQRLFPGSKSSFRSLTGLINQNLSFEDNY